VAVAEPVTALAVLAEEALMAVDHDCSRGREDTEMMYLYRARGQTG